MTDQLPLWIIWPIIIWAVGTAVVCVFYGLFLFFKFELLSCAEVFDRCCDGRCFRDALLWPLCLPWYWMPLLFVAAFCYLLGFSFNRLRAVRRRSYRTPYQSL